VPDPHLSYAQQFWRGRSTNAHCALRLSTRLAARQICQQSSRQGQRSHGSHNIKFQVKPPIPMASAKCLTRYRTPLAKRIRDPGPRSSGSDAQEQTPTRNSRPQTASECTSLTHIGRKVGLVLLPQKPSANKPEHENSYAPHGSRRMAKSHALEMAESDKPPVLACGEIRSCRKMTSSLESPTSQWLVQPP